MYSIKQTLLALGLAGLVTAPGAFAGIALDKSIIDFPADQVPRQDVYVNNDEAETAYVKVEVLEVTNPGTEQEERKVVTNPDELQFVATPAKIAIPPKGRKQVRLVNLAPPSDTEKVFRINFTPVLPPLQESESIVRVVIAYQVLALIHPAEPEENLEVRRDGNKLIIKNAGNSYALLAAGSQCDSNKENCVDLPSKRLYAGNTWSVDLSYDTPVNFSITNFKGTRQLSW